MPGDRTEQATPHRRERARKEGDLLHSREFTAAAGMLAGVLALGVAGRHFLGGWRDGFAALLVLGLPARWREGREIETAILLRDACLAILAPVGFVLCGTFFAALGAGVLQTGGLNLRAEAIRFRLDRVNPVANLQNLFSLRAMTRLGKSLVPAAALLLFAAHEMTGQLSIPPFSLARIRILGAAVYGLLLMAAVLTFGWAAVDYLAEWRSRESRLKMSREDLRQEYRETEGSPQIRSRIRGLQRQMRRRRVKADVSKAAVVLTNPTHYAVALGFDFVTMDAPRVLAKGRNLLAEEIKAEARWAGVPIVENPPLARSLFRSVEVGQMIPVDLYAAVAAILAYLYRQRVEDEMRKRRAAEAASKQARSGSSSADVPQKGKQP